VDSLKDRGAEFVVISDDNSVLDKGSAKFRVPGRFPEELSPILYALPIQHFAENLAPEGPQPG
jgi:glucosamine 6-phosphate synthetase-like amidotransferase/phosphosugar isomerase protein